MRRLVITCECGQKLQAPRSYLGKRVQCPKCGHISRLSSDETTLPGPTLRERVFGGKEAGWGPGAGPTESAKQRFGAAFDLFSRQQYAEALAIFEALAEDYPGHPDIIEMRAHCLRVMNRSALPGPGGGLLSLEQFNADTVRQVILEKLLHGKTDDIQLQAAELACRVLGLLDGHAQNAAPESPADSAAHEHPETGTDAAAGEDDESTADGPDVDRPTGPLPFSRNPRSGPSDHPGQAQAR